MSARQRLDEALVAKVKADTGSDRHRVIPPDTAVTMDYNPTRLNIEIDKTGEIFRINCG